MTFKIHFTHKGENVVDDVDDYFIVEGDTLEDIRDNANKELAKRNLDVHESNVWSEEIK
jgi:hypothetical protein